MPRKKKEAIDNYLQLDLIAPTEIEKLYKEFTEVKESSDKVRRGVFAKHTALSKKVDALTCQIENLQHQLIVMNEFILTRLGCIETKMDYCDEITCLNVTKLNVSYADKRHKSMDTMDVLTLSA